jgi:hypothetical protein
MFTSTTSKSSETLRVCRAVFADQFCIKNVWAPMLNMPLVTEIRSKGSGIFLVNNKVFSCCISSIFRIKTTDIEISTSYSNSPWKTTSDCIFFDHERIILQKRLV